MKKILSVFIFNNSGEQAEPPCDGIEYFYLQNVDELKPRLAKTKGKYSAIICGKPIDTELIAAKTEAEKAAADILAFDGGCFFKTGVIKSLSVETADLRLIEILYALGCKTVLTINNKPFEIAEVQNAYSDEIKMRLLKIINKFNRERAKLNKEIYSIVFNMICNRLESFYVAAMLSVYNKNLKAEELIDFDLLLKDNIVLYLALEKRFSACDLKKQRLKKFKISFITANKLKKFKSI